MTDLTFLNNSALYGEDTGSYGFKYLLNGKPSLDIFKVASSQFYENSFTISIVDYDE